MAFLEKREARNLQNCVEIGAEIETHLDDGHQYIRGDCNQYLNLHCVLGAAKKRFDTQVLFDALDEQLYLPAITIQLGNRLARYCEVWLES